MHCFIDLTPLLLIYGIIKIVSVKANSTTTSYLQSSTSTLENGTLVNSTTTDRTRSSGIDVVTWAIILLWFIPFSLGIVIWIVVVIYNCLKNICQLVSRSRTVHPDNQSDATDNNTASQEENQGLTNEVLERPEHISTIDELEQQNKPEETFNSVNHRLDMDNDRATYWHTEANRSKSRATDSDI